MKKIGILLFAMLFLLTCLAANIFAANTATEQTARRINFSGEGPVRYVMASLDTVDTDLTVYDPPSKRMACVVGIRMSNSSPVNLTLKSGSDTMVTLELASNQGLWGGGNTPLCTAPGEDLIIQASAPVNSVLFELVAPKKLFVESGR
ncbi:MAG: hypothetical protein KTR14_08050 [Vampirovibrio sp.]|nr:hypothetical protein [Vampirovibrio sp.]